MSAFNPDCRDCAMRGGKPCARHYAEALDPGAPMTAQAKCSPQKCANPQFMCASCPNRDQFHVPSAPPRAVDAPDHEAAEREFAAWLMREMPEGTVIGDPKWWAARLWRFASTLALSSRAAEPEKPAWGGGDMESQARSWLGVVRRLQERDPKWFQRPGSGYAKAIEAIDEALASPPVAPGGAS